MKEYQMYPHNPNSAESILNDHMKDISHGWLDDQRAHVIKAMKAYASQFVREAAEEAHKWSQDAMIMGMNQDAYVQCGRCRDSILSLLKVIENE